MNEINENSPKMANKKPSILRKNLTTILTVVSVIVAVVVGIILRKLSGTWNERSLMYLEFPGTMFLRALSGLILPIIMSSLISSVGSLDVGLSGRIGVRAIVYYMCTTILAVTLGITLVLSIRPGANTTVETGKNVTVRVTTTTDTMLDLVRNLVPSNLIQACFSQYSTKLTPNPDNLNETDYYKWDISGENRNGTNILGLIVFCIILGIMIGRHPTEGKPFLDVITSFNGIIMHLTGLVIKLTPIGVLFLVLPRIVGVKDVGVFFGSVGWYTLTVLIGLFIHGFLVLPLIYFLVTRKNPYAFILKLSEALLTAFGTASSSATLPVTIRCLISNLDVDERVANVLIPIGATINMDGTALYEAVATIFIAQSRSRYLNFVDVILVSLTATAASIGAAGIPQAGLVTMVMVLSVVGLPSDSISLIFVVDWLLDRFRTAVNVLGDSFGAAIVAHLSTKELRTIRAANQSNQEESKH